MRMFRLGPTRFCSFAFETNSTVKQWSKELVLHLCNLFFRVNLCGAAPELLVQRPVGGRTPPKATRCVFFFPHPLTTHFFWFWSRTSCIDLMSLSPIVLIGLFRMVTPTRLVAYHVVVTPLVGDSFQAQHLHQKKSVLLLCGCSG